MGRPSTGKYDSFARKLNKYIKDCRAEEKLPILKEFCLESNLIMNMSMHLPENIRNQN